MISMTTTFSIEPKNLTADCVYKKQVERDSFEDESRPPGFEPFT